MQGLAKASILAVLTAVGLFGQTAPGCRASVPNPPPDSRNIFTPAQEADLGDVMAESQLLGLRFLSEGDTTLQRIALRLVHDTPLSGLHIRVFIVDFPQANAFVLPGGRVYVSRALIALVGSEDELAGILAHEFGHLLAHQQSSRVSILLKSTLGVTTVGDRRDIFDKFARVLENAWRKPEEASHASSREERDQIEADRLGLLIQAAAGYDPSAQVRAIDRLLETKGHAASFLSNLFHFEPNRKRLAELLANLPPGCASSPSAATPEFLAWRKAALDAAPARLRESLPQLQSRVTLRPPLQGDLQLLRFSPDGRYVLAHDPAGITVLTLQPFQVAFRIPAESAGLARFTPDSRQIVFLSTLTHVERWDIATQMRLASDEVPLHKPCLGETLSPDGQVLACLDSEFTLHLLSVASGETLFEKKQSGLMPVSQPYLVSWAAVLAAGLDAPAMQFSPDARYFVAAPQAFSAASAIAWDLREKGPVALRGEFKKISNHSFAFVAADRVLLSPPVAGAKLGSNVTALLLSFPSGEVLARPTLPSGPLSPATDHSTVLIRPLGKFAVGAVDFVSGEVVTNKAPAIDAFGRLVVAERSLGELALYERGKGMQAAVQLPPAELRTLRGSALSPDSAWIALSTWTRGGVFDLRDGRFYAPLPAFDGAFFDSSGHLTVDIPKDAQRERHTALVTLNPFATVDGPDITSRIAQQVGPYVVVIRTADGSPPHFVFANNSYLDVILDSLDARTLKPVWSRNYRGEAPRFFFGASGQGSLQLWGTKSDRVTHDASARNALLSLAPTALRDERVCSPDDPFRRAFGYKSDVLTSGLYLAEALDPATGRPGAPVLIDLVDRCLGVLHALPMDGAVALQDVLNRVLIFRSDVAQARLRFFGRLLDVDPARNRIAVGKEAGRIVVYDGDVGTEVANLSFPAPLVFVRFQNEGRALFALTTQHEAITVRLP